VPVPFTVGEEIRCDILIPSHVASRLYLHCRARVLRVESAGSESSYGIACRIEQYSVIRDHTSEGSTSNVLCQNGKTKTM
jgi:hypothetical protein